MQTLVAVLLVLATVFAAVEAFRSRSFGWAGLACLFAAVWMIPALLALP